MTGNEKDDEDVKTLGEALRAAEDRATGLSTRVEVAESALAAMTKERDDHKHWREHFTRKSDRLDLELEGAEAALATARELHNALLVLVDKRFRELHIEARQQYDRAEKAESALAASREREEGLARAVEGLICGGCGWRLSNPCTRKPCEACDPIKAALSVSVRLALSPAASAETPEQRYDRLLGEADDAWNAMTAAQREGVRSRMGFSSASPSASATLATIERAVEASTGVPVDVLRRTPLCEMHELSASAGAGEEININDPTWVRLTNNGRALYLAHFARMRCHAPVLSDEQGWARFQLWDLAAIFGPHLYNGCDLPFETTIRLSPPPGAPREAARAAAQATACPDCHGTGHRAAPWVCGGDVPCQHSNMPPSPAPPAPPAASAGPHALACPRCGQPAQGTARWVTCLGSPGRTTCGYRGPPVPFPVAPREEP
jgi:hypothetical protein